MNSNVHISFDLDGTLIDSIPLMRESWENVNSKLGFGIGWEAYKKNIGLPFAQICKNLLIENMHHEIHELYFKFNQENIDKIKPMNGLQGCIDWLMLNNIDWSIITSKPKKTTIPILELFDLNPSVLITACDVETGKPNLESSQLLISQLSDKINKIYYVGDTTIDHLFAINSGFDFIEFSESSANPFILNFRHVISNLTDIQNIVK
jgi:phosphoglycolate phosphatase-like HAD superfamily hydrolase